MPRRRAGRTASMSRGARQARQASRSWARSAIRQDREASIPASPRVRGWVRSGRGPPVTHRRRGQPRRSARTWIGVPKPPRRRPGAGSASCLGGAPAARLCARTTGLSRRAADRSGGTRPLGGHRSSSPFPHAGGPARPCLRVGRNRYPVKNGCGALGYGSSGDRPYRSAVRWDNTVGRAYVSAAGAPKNEEAAPALSRN